jgi:transcriptional regulator with XRE-family HTH domain
VSAAPKDGKGGKPRPEPQSSSPEALYEADLLASSVVHVVKGMMEAGQISQRELARRLGVSEARVSRLLHDSENLKLSVVAALGRAVGIRFGLVPIPFDDRSGTPAADDPPPPRWIAEERRLGASATSASGPPPQPKRRSVR